ncbi:MAG: flavin reductase family protein [Gemmatimonadales bacterium]
MLTDTGYELLRQLASPMVAVTTARAGRVNGMILDSAIRASISPVFPRLSVYIHKWHLTHEYLWETGVFTAHLLHRGQLELVHRLGFASGRDREKLGGIAYRLGEGRAPVLEDCYAAFECRVVNTMDAGASTAFLADVTDTHRGPGTDILTAEYFREHLPDAWRDEFLANYRDAQERIAQLAEIRDVRM